MKVFPFSLLEFLVVIVIIAVLINVVLGGTYFLVQIPCYIFVGWIWGLGRLAFRFIQEPLAALALLFVLASLPILLHLFQKKLPRNEQPTWSFRRTCKLSLYLGLAILSGAALSASCLEIYRLSTEPKQVLNVVWDYRAVTYRMQSTNYLRQIGIGVHNYHDTYESMPSGGTILEDGRLGHGWMTQLLPFCEEQVLYDKIDLTKPWNDLVNAEHFKSRANYCFNTSYFNSLSPNEKVDAEGFWKTDYAVNERVLPIGRSLKMEEITDGTSNTILHGEAMGCYQPWGSPLNGRDAAFGVNQSPFGFGNAHVKTGCNLGLCDGSVRFFSATTDSQVMRALATPNGGERVYP